MHQIAWIIAGGNALTSPLCGEYNGKADQCPTKKEGHYYKRFKYNCKKVTCPACYEKQIAKQAHFALERFNAIRKTYYMNGGHIFAFGELILSPPATTYHQFDTKEGFDAIRKQALQYSEQCGIIGGFIVTHPYRGRKTTMDSIRLHTYKNPQPSFHFHIIGIRLIGGWIKSNDFEAATGWVYKWVDEYKQNGDLRNMYNKIAYELNHAGLYRYNERFSPITSWFGVCSRHAVKQNKTTEHIPIVCPVCKAIAHRYELDESIDKGESEHRKTIIDYTIPQAIIERARMRFKLTSTGDRHEDLAHEFEGVKTRSTITTMA